MKKTALVYLLFAVLILQAGCAPAAASQPAATAQSLSLTFMAGYKPQADLPFVGVYVAQEKDFFKEENLAVTIQHSPGGGQHLQLVASGKVQVTTQDAAVMLQRRENPGLPLVSIALIGQHGQQAYAALAKSGLKTPKDWEGHTVGYKGTPPPDLMALMAAAGANPNNVKLVNVGFDPRILTEGKVDVYPVFKSNEPYQIRKWGYDVTLWDADTYHVPTLGLAYVTSEDILAKQPEALTRFLRAALKGIEYAKAHPDEAIDIVMKYAGPSADRGNMRFMMDSELADADTDLTREHGIGWQTTDQWQALENMLVKYGAMKETDVSKAFTTKLLEQANK